MDSGHGSIDHQTSELLHAEEDSRLAPSGVLLLARIASILSAAGVLEIL